MSQGSAASADRFLQDVVAGLTSTPKRLPCKYFYDQRGSKLFDRICALDEYYLTRTEVSIMRRHAPDMAGHLGPRCLLVELGSGSSQKTRLLLAHLREPAAYVPVDISKEYMTYWAGKLAADFPRLNILPVHADFSQPFEVPEVPAARRRVIFFPGSTIGNFTPPEAGTLLARMARLARPGGGLLIGVDLKKDASTLEAAYNDAKGVTREFNLNLLKRIRRELQAEIQLNQFEHRAFYNESQGRVEMHLVSTVPQVIRLDHTDVKFAQGETIHTESCYKYSLEEFAQLAGRAGFRQVAVWTDERKLFSVQYLIATNVR